MEAVDIVEQSIADMSMSLLKILLADKTTKRISDGRQTIIYRWVKIMGLVWRSSQNA